MIQFNNFVKKLIKFDIKVLTTLDDFIIYKNENKYPQLTMTCLKNHEFTMKLTSLSNKLTKSNVQLCAQCNIPEISGEELKVREKCIKLGFTFISFQDRTVSYKCKCENITTTHSSNILDKERKAQCPKCQNNSYRNDINNIRIMFEEKGCELLSEYTNRHKPVKYRCICGNEAFIRLSDFIKGKTCINCKPLKYKATCQELYGVDNMFQLDSIKETSKLTCLKNHGVEYCMQSPIIYKKAMSSSFHRQKYVNYKAYEWIVQGYEPQCINDLLVDYDPKDIIAGDTDLIPTCKYKFNNKICTWYPDIYLPIINTLIEVKSTFTYNKSALRTCEKILQSPYNTELRIYNKDGSIFEKISKNITTNKIDYLYGNKFVLGELIEF